MLSRDHQTHVLIQLIHRNCNESPYVPCGICLYAEYIQCLCSAIESEVVEALAMFRLPACGACGCLMRPGARLPNAQQSVAQATTAGLALYNCSRVRTHVYVCTHVYTIVCTHVRRYTGVHNCEHSWTSLCAHTNAQCSLNTMPKIWAALNHGQCRFFLRNFWFNFILWKFAFTTIHCMLCIHIWIWYQAAFTAG